MTEPGYGTATGVKRPAYGSPSVVPDARRLADAGRTRLLEGNVTCR